MTANSENSQNVVVTIRYRGKNIGGICFQQREKPTRAEMNIMVENVIMGSCYPGDCISSLQDEIWESIIAI